MLHKTTTPGHRMLVEAYLALGVGFATIAIPLAFDARWTSAAWALEGAALVWVGVRQLRPLARASGILLIGASGVAFIGSQQLSGRLPLLNGTFLGMLLISLSALFASFFLYRHRDSLKVLDRVAAVGLLCWGVLWWFGCGLSEIDTQLTARFEYPAIIAFLALSPALGVRVSRKMNWPPICWPTFVAIPLLLLAALISTVTHSHPFVDFGFLAWPLAIVVMFMALRGMEDRFPRAIPWFHAPQLWILAVIVAAEIAYLVGRITTNELWQMLAVIVWLVGLTVFVLRTKIPWPVTRHREVYLAAGVGLPLTMCMLWVWMLNMTAGDPKPIPYIPVLNPLDLVSLLVVLVTGLWLLEFKDRIVWLQKPQNWWNGAAILGFLLATATVVRTVHHWTDVPFESEALFRSVELQATLSLFWGVAGLGAMITGARRVQRKVWFTGAALMAVVVLKLFLIDLSNTGTLARVFSFLGVGLLLLVVGYFAGVPPRREISESSDNAEVSGEKR
jgi:uncharacterized membrane protein